MYTLEFAVIDPNGGEPWIIMVVHDNTRNGAKQYRLFSGRFTGAGELAEQQTTVTLPGTVTHRDADDRSDHSNRLTMQLNDGPGYVFRGAGDHSRNDGFTAAGEAPLFVLNVGNIDYEVTEGENDGHASLTYEAKYEANC